MLISVLKEIVNAGGNGCLSGTVLFKAKFFECYSENNHADDN